MSTCTPNLDEQLIENTAMLTAVNTAITATLTGDHTEYWFDSGQTMQKVKRLDLKQMYELRKQLQIERARLCNEINGPSIATPIY